MYIKDALYVVAKMVHVVGQIRVYHLSWLFSLRQNRRTSVMKIAEWFIMKLE